MPLNISKWARLVGEEEREREGDKRERERKRGGDKREKERGG